MLGSQASGGGNLHGENADRAWQGLALGCSRSDLVGLRLRLVDRGILANGFEKLSIPDFSPDDQ
jgi:hypothetical protein